MIMIRLSASNSVRTAGKIPKPHPDSDGDLHVRRWRRRWRLITLETALLISALRAFLIFFFSLVAVFSSPDKLKYASDTFERGA